MEQSEKIKQNWTGSENFPNYFSVIFVDHCRKYYFWKESWELSIYVYLIFVLVAIQIYNLSHNILELYNVLIQIRLTTSKMKRDI